MATTTEDKILTSLREIIDPCSVALGRPLDLVDMGLIEKIDVDAGHVDITVVLTDAACAFYQDMQRQIRDAACMVDGVHDVEVHIAPKLWHPSRLAPR
ncbi:iron-sulfur cluster assembly protein [Actinoplanes bogorensis]|uniref:Iron-sulfur cluster assembly protein n=1 Tax=Paractinoplanes bogorensis TaxID=1610840 RepID=A0ABS5YUR6_9ACTN|nr:iron-sulfur cluster assembly protein [Actinoplanes bogorensis]MBU2667195.1 iron-sulfur cluster assembly protein [Actinoplanes bogorensis]